MFSTLCFTDENKHARGTKDTMSITVLEEYMQVFKKISWRGKVTPMQR
jgi:hypothetical protein